jgi:hypothetical protein
MNDPEETMFNGDKVDCGGGDKVNSRLLCLAPKVNRDFF